MSEKKMRGRGVIILIDIVTLIIDKYTPIFICICQTFQEVFNISKWRRQWNVLITFVVFSVCKRMKKSNGIVTHVQNNLLWKMFLLNYMVISIHETRLKNIDNLFYFIHIMYLNPFDSFNGKYRRNVIWKTWLLIIWGKLYLLQYR